MGQKFAFTVRGREFTFGTREDYQKAFSNYLLVDSRREYGQEITEEDLLECPLQFDTTPEEGLTETEKQATMELQ